MKQSAVLKFVHGDQMSRLQQKYQLDIELLDDLRSELDVLDKLSSVVSVPDIISVLFYSRQILYNIVI